jgi:hypothetical protein
MEYRPGKLDVAEMTWTFRHSFAASLTLLGPFYGSQTRIEQSANLDTRLGLIHRIGKLDFENTHRFATPPS